MAKSNRSRVIGDPLKKFKRPSLIQECDPRMQKHLEKLMEKDHRAGYALKAALMVSSRSGLPDKWFFDKARDLGYKFEDERVFWEEQCRRLRSEKRPPKDRNTELTEGVIELERSIRHSEGDDVFEQAALEMSGSIEQWRVDTKKRLMDELDEMEQKLATSIKEGKTFPL